MKKYRLADQAKQDLRDIADFIGERNLPAAQRVLQALRETFSILANHPRIGMSRDDLSEGLYVFPGKRPANQFVVCYYAIDEGIEVSCVIAGARDWEGMFKRGER